MKALYIDRLKNKIYIDYSLKSTQEPMNYSKNVVDDHF